MAIIEARMTSSRLPGKVLLPADGIPMLKHLITRLEAVPSLHLALVEVADLQPQQGRHCETKIGRDLYFVESILPPEDRRHSPRRKRRAIHWGAAG